MRLWIAGLGALLAATACSEPLVFEEWTVPVPEGTEIIGHEHVPREERTARLEFVEDLVIGRDDDPDYSFYQAWGVAVDSSGNIYVMDRGNHRIQVFDDRGQYLRTLGSEGQGPGELQSPVYSTVAGDAGVVVDSTNRRLTRWSTVDGRLLGSSPMSEASLEVLGLADGTLVGTHVIFHGEPQFFRERLYGHFSIEGTELERYTVIRLLPPASVSVPNAIEQLAATPDGDVYITRADRYQVLAFSADGEARWALRTTLQSPEIPEEIFENALRRLRERQPDYERPDTWLERMPAIGNMEVDGRGHLYVFEYVFVRRDPFTGETLEEPSNLRAVDVYSREGELLSAALTDRAGWWAAHGDYVYSSGLDPDTDEEVIRRHRLLLPWEE